MSAKSRISAALALTLGGNADVRCQTGPTASSAPASAPLQLEQVTVTATKRGADIVQNVPLSIQTISGLELKQRGADDFNGLFRFVPGLGVADSGSGDKRYIVRGIGASGPGTVGVYLDEAIITGENAQDGGGQQVDIKLFDLARVEVLRGPQGTTFGSSSLAGTVRYIAKKPAFDVTAGTVNYALASTKGAALGHQADIAVNIAIVPNRLAIRVAGFHAELPGYINNRFGNGIDGERTTASRLSARLAVSDAVTLTATTMSQTTKEASKSYFNLADDGMRPEGSYRQADVARAPYADRNQIGNATLEYASSAGNFTLTGSRFDRDLEFDRDASLVAQAFFGLPFLGAGRSVISQPKHRRLDSYEARFASTFDGPMNMLLGVFRQDEHRNFESLWRTVGINGVPNADSTSILDRRVSSKIEERAAFGEFTYALTKDVKALFGIRHFDFRLSQQTEEVTGVGGAPGSGPGTPGETRNRGFIPRYNIAYSPNEISNIYIQAAKGFRAGGNNDQTTAALANVSIPAGFAPDTLWNYEVGAKIWSADGGYYLNVAAYYIDWSNVQVQLQTTALGSDKAFPYTGNGASAVVKGLELEAGARPLTGLNLTAGLSYNDAALGDSKAASLAGRKGDRLPYVARLTGSVVADYEFEPLFSNVRATLGGDLTYTGRRGTDLVASSPLYHVLPAAALVSLRFGIKGKTGSVALVASNVFNNQKPINVTSTIAGVTPDQFYVAKPRTFVVRVATSF